MWPLRKFKRGIMEQASIFVQASNLEDEVVWYPADTYSQTPSISDVETWWNCTRGISKCCCIDYEKEVGYGLTVQGSWNDTARVLFFAYVKIYWICRCSLWFRNSPRTTKPQCYPS
jgi:hypothetical protein